VVLDAALEESGITKQTEILGKVTAIDELLKVKN
jgi:hypothetical protein